MLLLKTKENFASYSKSQVNMIPQNGILIGSGALNSNFHHSPKNEAPKYTAV
jgi:hypothetical protein